MAETTFATSVRWSKEGLLCEGDARGFKVSMDEPVELGGSNKAMNPVEMVLCALGGCLTICAAAFAGPCHVDLRNMSVEVEGDLDPDGFMGLNHDARKGLRQIRFRIHLESPSPKANIDRLVKLIKERCPVSDTLRGVEVLDKTEDA